jgi:hypothetical protein
MPADALDELALGDDLDLLPLLAFDFFVRLVSA